MVYTLPNRLNCIDFTPPIAFGEAIQLIAHCQPAFPQRIPAGQIALLGLNWRTLHELSVRYTVTVQLLDARTKSLLNTMLSQRVVRFPLMAGQQTAAL